MTVDYDKMHTDIIKKLNRIKMSQRQASTKIGISRSTIFRISKKKPIHLETYIKITDWLEKNLDDYIIKPNRPYYIKKRLQKNKQPMKLLHDLILVRPTKKPIEKSGLIIPGGIENQNKGEIVLIGSKVQKLKVGDKIIYTSNQGTHLEYENEPMILLSESRNELFLDD